MASLLTMGPHEELQAALPRLDSWDGKEPEALDAFVRAVERYVREVDPRGVDAATTLSIFARATAAGSRGIAKAIEASNRNPERVEQIKTGGRRLQEVVTLLAHAGASRVKARS